MVSDNWEANEAYMDLLDKKEKEKRQIVKDSEKQNLRIMQLSQELQAAKAELEIVQMEAQEDRQSLSEKLKSQDLSIQELRAQLGYK